MSVIERHCVRARIRPDGKTEEQWRNILNQARDTLIDAQKRREYVATFLLQADVLAEISLPQDRPLSENEFQDIEPIPSNIPEPTVPNAETDITPASDLETASSPDITRVPPNIDAPTDMVLIPAGEFQMGSQDEDANGTERRVHSLFVEAFLIDKYPVTNAQYKIFLDANPQWQKKRIVEIYHDGNYLITWSGNNYPRGKADYPVVDVSWYAAMAYTQWSGKRLPTEAEWEKTARGGLVGKIYPWGDEIDMSMANFGMHVGKTTLIGKYPPNDYGVYDMVGNVWEWCLDEYDHSSQRPNPGLIVDSISEITNNFLSIETSRVVRGGSWASSERAAQVAYCGWAAPIVTYYSYGLRCVKDTTS